MRWIDWITKALRNLGGQASYTRLYTELMKIRTEPFPRTWKAIVRRTVEDHSSDSENYRDTRPDLFYSVDRIGSGIWGLRGYHRFQTD